MIRQELASLLVGSRGARSADESIACFGLSCLASFLGVLTRTVFPPHAVALRADTTKYFGTELGAQTKFDEASGLAIVNGAHETNRLSQLLEGFIKRFVQCGQCNNPETDIVLTKKETIELKCKACGAVTQVDMRHKLCTFILKNPPVIKDKSKKCAPDLERLLLAWP